MSTSTGNAEAFDKLRELLTAEEALKFKSFETSLIIREEQGFLAMCGVDSERLKAALIEYFKATIPHPVEPFHFQSDDPFKELLNTLDDGLAPKTFYLYDLTGVEKSRWSKVFSSFMIFRDFIHEKRMKLLLICDHEMLRRFSEEAFDFVAFAIFHGKFTDHGHTPLPPLDLSELEAMIDEYNRYLGGDTVNPQTTMERLNRIGEKAYLYGQQDLAETYWKEGLGIAQKEHARFEIGIFTGNIGLINQDKGNLDNALRQYQYALEIHKKIGYSQGVAEQLGNISLIYRVRGDLENALNYQKEALQIHREIGYHQGIASSLSNIGLFYLDKGNLDVALDYMKDALEIGRQIGYQEGLASTLANIGLIYKAKGNLDQALKYHKEALKIHYELGYREGLALDLINIGRINQDRDSSNIALEYYNEALEIAQSDGYTRIIQIAQSNIEEIQSQHGH